MDYLIYTVTIRIFCRGVIIGVSLVLYATPPDSRRDFSSVLSLSFVFLGPHSTVGRYRIENTFLKDV